MLIANDALCVGLPTIDVQHREMAELLNVLEAIITGAGSDELLFAVLERLYERTRAHFELEEKAMEQMAYAGAVEHRREHTMLMADLKTFIARLHKGQEKLDGNALAELKDWLVGHVLGSDRAFAAAAIEAGLKL